jgi:acetyl-CoA carboxylase biotin carboxylase subunit
VARSVSYTSAGTIEFLVDQSGAFYFLEMNTRLQVEHPITEMVTGVDLVRWQINLAQGARLDLDPSKLMTPIGHAIECRIYAEDPDNGFLPSPGRIQNLRVPAGPGIRDDSGATHGYDVPVYYDPMISKLVAWAEDRPTTIRRMQRALSEYQVTGIRTTVPFFTWLFAQSDFAEGRFHTAYLDEILRERNGWSFSESAPVRPGTPSADDVAAIAAALQAVLSPGTHAASTYRPGGEGGPQRWKAQARAEALGLGPGRER